jgi:hypothetical protein
MLRIIERIARAIPKSAIEIAAIILLTAAIWYAFEILVFSSLPESEIRDWLRVSEWVLFASAILLAIGLVGEWKESEEWKASLTYKAAKYLVLIGVVGELLGDGGVFKAGDRVTDLQDKKIIALESQRSLSDAQKGRIAIVTGMHPGLPFVLVTAPESEPWTFALDIAATLKADGWNWQACENPDHTSLSVQRHDKPSECTSIVDHVEVDAPAGLLLVANALANAIREPGLFGMDRAWPDPSVTPHVMTIIVGSKR